MRKSNFACLALLPLALQLAGPCRADGQRPRLCDARPRTADLGFTLVNTAGEAVDLRSYRGRVIVINFWATWCAPCRTEIPWLVEAFEAHREAGLVVLGVSVDQDVSRIAPFAAALRMHYPVLRGHGEQEFQDAFGPLLGFPTTILVTRKGDICLRHTGITERARLEAGIRELLAAR